MKNKQKMNDWLTQQNLEPDYTTNSKDYYHSLARKTKLIKLLALKIWDYEELLDITLEDLEKRLQWYIEKWDENLETLPDDLVRMLQDWMDDGTLDHIINETIFNWKVDQTEFDDFVDNTTSQLAQKASATISEKILYVDSNLGDDLTGNGSEEQPFKTIQKAYDEIPSIVVHQYIIQLADGVYSEGKLGTARPSLLYAENKFTGKRTNRKNLKMEGSIVIRGNPTDYSAVQLIPSANLDYGIYNVQGQISLENIHLKAEHSLTSLLVSHRQGSYVHGTNIQIDGNNNVNYGAYTESGAIIELTGESNIFNCSIGVSSLTKSDVIVLSSYTNIYNCGTGIHNTQGGMVKFTGLDMRIYDCELALRGLNGSLTEFSAYNSNNRTSIESPVEIDRGAQLTATYTNFWGKINVLNESLIYLNNSSYQDEVNVNHATVIKRTANSFVSPNVKSNVLTPLKLFKSNYKDDGNNSIVNLDGETISFSHSLSVTTDNEILNIFRPNESLHLTGGSANRMNCTLSIEGVSTGTIMHLFATTWGVEIVNGETANIQGGKILLGSGSTSHRGITLAFYNGKWCEVGRTPINQ